MLTPWAEEEQVLLIRISSVVLTPCFVASAKLSARAILWWSGEMITGMQMACLKLSFGFVCSLN